MKYQVEIQQQDKPLLVIRLLDVDENEVHNKIYSNPWVKVADETEVSIKGRVDDLIKEYDDKVAADAVAAAVEATEMAAVQTLKDVFVNTQDSTKD